jgi:putative restriction endonuclease
MGSEVPRGNETPGSRKSKITRVVRSNAVDDWVKRSHDFTYQICGTALKLRQAHMRKHATSDRSVAPTTLPDVAENVLCLCPNCQVLFDELSLWINDDRSFGGKGWVASRKPDKRRLR